MKENADKARALDANEISKQIKDTAEQMFRLRFQMSMGQMDGIKKLRSLRKERARMLTVLRERQDGASQVVAAQRPARAKSLPKPAAQETAKTKPAAATKAKAVAAPKVRKEASQVKVKPTAAPKSAKISMPRKSGKG
jgi:large subunit ribosomal protein L29